MENNEIINKVIKLTERITSGGDINRVEISRMLKLLDYSDRNLSVYKGILITHYFYKFKELPQIGLKSIASDERFLKCVAILDGSILRPSEIGGLFLNILTIPDDRTKYRDMLLGSFYGSLWFFMNNPENFEIAIDYGVEIIKSAFSIDGFDFSKKIKLKKKDAKLINLAGSGKKEIKLLNISSMAAVVTAATGKKISTNIVVEKTISRATSSVTGSGDIFGLAGVNLDMPINEMAKISLETKLGVFDINKIVPKLNHIYDGHLYNIQVFAGLVGGAAIANPIDTDLINYGLTRGSSRLCLAILNKLHPNKNIIVLQGKNSKGRAVIDQISIAANTAVAQRINGKNSLRIITPREFGFDFKPFKHIQTAKNSEENIKQFIRLLSGKGNENLKQAVAMEVALNLYGLGIIDDLKICAELALDTIHSGEGINILEDLVVCSKGSINKFSRLLKVCLN